MDNKNVEFTENFINSINFIHEVKIYNEIQNSGKILVFDLRSRADFDKSHLENSINIPLDEFDFEFFEKFDENKIANLVTDDTVKSMVLKYKRYFIVIIMSETRIQRKTILDAKSAVSKEEQDTIKKSLQFYKSLTDNKVRELGLYNLGFKKFSEVYYFMITNNKDAPLAR